MSFYLFIYFKLVIIPCRNQWKAIASASKTFKYLICGLWFLICSNWANTCTSTGNSPLTCMKWKEEMFDQTETETTQSTEHTVLKYSLLFSLILSEIMLLLDSLWPQAELENTLSPRSIGPCLIVYKRETFWGYYGIHRQFYVFKGWSLRDLRVLKLKDKTTTFLWSLFFVDCRIVEFFCSIYREQRKDKRGLWHLWKRIIFQTPIIL